MEYSVLYSISFWMARMFERVAGNLDNSFTGVAQPRKENQTSVMMRSLRSFKRSHWGSSPPRCRQALDQTTGVGQEAAHVSGRLAKVLTES